MSESALKSDHRRVVNKHIKYIRKDGKEIRLDSSYEVIFAKILDENEINWERPKSLKWNDNGIFRKYFADFLLVDFGILVDTKNDYLIIRDARKISLVEELNEVKINIVRKDELTLKKICSLIRRLTDA